MHHIGLGPQHAAVACRLHAKFGELAVENTANSPNISAGFSFPSASMTWPEFLSYEMRGPERDLTNALAHASSPSRGQPWCHRGPSMLVPEESAFPRLLWELSRPEGIGRKKAHL